jgi:hypothetical protein
MRAEAGALIQTLRGYVAALRDDEDFACAFIEKVALRGFDQRATYASASRVFADAYQTYSPSLRRIQMAGDEAAHRILMRRDEDRIGVAIAAFRDPFAVKRGRLRPIETAVEIESGKLVGACRNLLQHWQVGSLKQARIANRIVLYFFNAPGEFHSYVNQMKLIPFGDANALVIIRGAEEIETGDLLISAPLQNLINSRIG